MRMKQIASKRYCYVSPLLKQFRGCAKVDKERSISPWKSKNSVLRWKETKMPKEELIQNTRDACAIKPLHDAPARSNKVQNLGIKRFRPKKVRPLDACQ